MSIDRLLSALTMVRAGANLSWTARCPSHDDRNPSLSIRALCDGRILMHCHAL
jgi:putative DNA primase/helicase